MEELELRMYFFVPYNLSPIQQGIQAGHAALEYAHKFHNTELFQKFMNNKTWIILNGGTTNYKNGTLNQINEDLWAKDIPHSLFHEPDLNDALTAICFIVDERVFNKERYPNFMDWLLDVKMYREALNVLPHANERFLRNLSDEKSKELFPEFFDQWTEFIGGQKNLFLRDLLKNKKLA